MSKKRLIRLWGLALIIIASLTFPPAWGQIDTQSPSNRDLAVITTSEGSVISAEVADTPAKRSQGLMFRTNMPRDQGMLFIFKELDHWTFWMKNTKMPLDIIWLDTAQKVVHIESNVPICTRTDEGCPRYHTLKEALYVLELVAGMAKHHNLTLGSQLTIRLP